MIVIVAYIVLFSSFTHFSSILVIEAICFCYTHIKMIIVPMIVAGVLAKANAWANFHSATNYKYLIHFNFKYNFNENKKTKN